MFDVEKIFDFFIKNFETIKTILYFVSLIYSFNLFLIWLYFEIKNKDETGFWLGLLDLIKKYKNFNELKSKTPTYEEIKKSYLKNHKRGLINLKNYFLFVLDVLGYSGENFEEKINNISDDDLPNKEDVKKAVKAISLLEKSDQELDEEEYELLFSTLEKALYYLNIIEKEDFLVTFLK
jgi:hypothetical protein